MDVGDAPEVEDNYGVEVKVESGANDKAKYSGGVKGEGRGGVRIRSMRELTGGNILLIDRVYQWKIEPLPPVTDHKCFNTRYTVGMMNGYYQ